MEQNRKRKQAMGLHLCFQECHNWRTNRSKKGLEGNGIGFYFETNPEWIVLNDKRKVKSPGKRLGIILIWISRHMPTWVWA